MDPFQKALLKGLPKPRSKKTQSIGEQSEKRSTPKKYRSLERNRTLQKEDSENRKTNTAQLNTVPT